jgi:hypothetical protein
VQQGLYSEEGTVIAISSDPPQSETAMSIPRELIEQLRKGNVVLFCGAGISISEGGIPSGGQLAQELIQRAGLSNVGNTSLPEVAQAYELEVDHHSLIDYITDRIEAASRQPLRTHQLVATLPFQRIITTNWDTLLEEALRQAGKTVVKVVRDDDIPYIDEEKVTLIKLHGTVDQRDTIVITGDDYYDVFIRLPATANQVRGYFATKTVLFLGYGLADEDFKRLYHEVERHLGKHKRRAYAVQLDPMPLTVTYWEQKNVQVIAADATAFLDALAKELGVTPPSPEPPGVVRQPRRIDAALPSRAQVGKPIDSGVAGELSESWSLAPEEIRAAGTSRELPDDAKPDRNTDQIAIHDAQDAIIGDKAKGEQQVSAPSVKEGKTEPSVPVKPTNLKRMGKPVYGQLLKILRDQSWQGIAGVVSIIALIITLVSIGVPARVGALLSRLTVAPLLTPTSTPTLTPTPTRTPTMTPTPTPTCPDIQKSCLELVLTTNTNHLTCATGNPLVILIKPEDIQGMVDLKGKAIDSTGKALISGVDGCTCEWQGKVGADPLKPINSTEDCGFSIGLPTGVNSILLRLTVVGQPFKDFLIKIQP